MYREMFHKGIEWRAHAHAIRRLYGNWMALRADNPDVPFHEFDPATMGDIADDMIVFRPAGDGYMVYAHYGRSLIDRVGTDKTGQASSRIREAVGAFFRECNARVLESGEPLLTLHRSALSGQVHLWERLVLPCRDTDGEPVIVIIAKPRQFRDDLLAAVLDASLDAIVAVHLVRDDSGTPVDGEFVSVNRRAAEWSGVTVDAMLQSSVLTLCPWLAESGLWSRYVDVAVTREPLQLVTRYPCADAERWLEIACVPFGDGFMVTQADITERKQAEDAMRQSQAEYARANAALKAEILRRKALEEELSHLATRDSLTGALNRRAITQGLRDAIARSARYAHPVSIVTMDLDHFKHINDRFGHAGGDAVLRRTVDLLTHGLREDVDLVGRLGGEEFVVVLPHIGAEEAVGVARRMRALLAAASIDHDDDEIRFTGSFGVAAWDGRETMDRLLSRADAALYKAKAAGRDRVALDEGEGEIHVLGLDGEMPLQPSADLPAFSPSTRQGTAPRAPRRASSPALARPPKA
ncbi:MAG: diguanylate cyclase [Phreatobacter sp.]|uniref:sensor domain-containing diguanylate cyclase n=1 Tax=Phreatobacter sp. TaxID=1966341 RepID=UPI002733C4DD|nr:sensor domain-containing diguanylate cyclase [Phreatobacter sp.]MDP2802600.1 diguanylate cyclase [Phreatobacter sp.]